MSDTSTTSEPAALSQEVAAVTADQTTPQPQAIEAPAKTPQREPGYTAVIFFHGMGSQHRYSGMSNLVEDLEAYDRTISTDKRGGWLKHVVGKLEPVRTDAPPPGDAGTANHKPVQGGRPAHEDTRGIASYIDLRYTGPQPSPDATTDYRFYEAYWAPVTAGGVPMWEVLWWLITRVGNPWHALKAHWRARRRYRISSLFALLDDPRNHQFSWDDDTCVECVVELLTAYDRFEGSRGRLKYKDGSFRQFYEYLDSREWAIDVQDGEDERAGDGRDGAETRTQRQGTGYAPEWSSPEARRRCLELATEWHRGYANIELRNSRVLTSLLVALFSIGVLLFTAAVGFISALPGLGGSSSPWGLALSVITVILTIVGVRGFFQDYLGDVVFWSTYEEVDVRYKKRAEILDLCTKLVRHVVSDPQCRRAVIVAHSLGTTIAYETLLYLGRFNRARSNQRGAALLDPIPLDKIDQLITYGSPIDKIFYFFQNDTDEMHRYHRVLESIRGDLAQVPFSTGDRPRIHWINFWDSADIISGPLQTPQPLNLERKQKPSPRKRFLRVDNVQVWNKTLLPAASHGAYTENKAVQQIMYETIFQGQHSFVTQEQMASTPSPAQPRQYSFLHSQDCDDTVVRRFHKRTLFACWGVALAGPPVLYLLMWLLSILMGIVGLVWQPSSVLALLLLAPLFACGAAIALGLLHFGVWSAHKAFDRELAGTTSQPTSDAPVVVDQHGV